MKIEIVNFGPINRCEYDLSKSLIVTYGENNIGKSYAMQVIYLLLKKIMMCADYYYYMEKFYPDIKEQREEIADILKNFVLNSEIQTLDVTNDIIFNYKKNLEKLLLNEVQVSLENTFGAYEEILKQNPVIKLQLDGANEYTFLLNENKMEINIEAKKVFLKKTISDFHKSRNNKGHYDIYVYENHINTPTNLLMEKINELSRNFAHNLLGQMKGVYFLPASRSGIYTGMSSFGPIMAQLSQNRAYINRSFQIPSIPEPISDYYMALSNIRNDKNIKLEEIAREIEEEILKGEVKFDSRKKTLLYQGKVKGHSFEMNDVSSMISEISPIVAYLKYIVRTGNRAKFTMNASSIIFIEEPEAYLHPINQIKLMKIFTKLAKTNIKLVIASHSNYIFNELNNRVLAGELDKNTYSPILMKWENEKSNTYYMDMDEFGVSDSNFADASEILCDEREELIIKLMEKMENENN